MRIEFGAVAMNELPFDGFVDGLGRPERATPVPSVLWRDVALCLNTLLDPSSTAGGRAAARTLLRARKPVLVELGDLEAMRLVVDPPVAKETPMPVDDRSLQELSADSSRRAVVFAWLGIGESAGADGPTIDSVLRALKKRGVLTIEIDLPNDPDPTDPPGSCYLVDLLVTARRCEYTGEDEDLMAAILRAAGRLRAKNEHG